MSHFEFDIHTHTIASGHGSAATITDMVKTARTQHLNMLGISDHGPATLGGGKPAYFRNLTYAPKNPDGNPHAVRCRGQYFRQSRKIWILRMKF